MHFPFKFLVNPADEGDVEGEATEPSAWALDAWDRAKGIHRWPRAEATLLLAATVALLAVTARGPEYDPGTDYMALMEAEEVAGDAEAGQTAEAARNAKISGAGNPDTEIA